jgi:hypothetical protein
MPERIDNTYPFYIWDQVLDGNTWRSAGAMRRAGPVAG